MTTMRRTLRSGALALAALGVLAAWGPAAAADASRCAKADDRLARTGRGDRDFDGLSNCSERRVFDTGVRDPDSDGDGVRDGDEVARGSDPRDPDSDDDGSSDGREARRGTNPLSSDSDDDGIHDGDDADPLDDLGSEIEGAVDSVVCPAVAQPGTLVVLGIPLALDETVSYRGVNACDDLAARAATSGTHVEVDVSGDLVSGFQALRVHAEDGDDDGSPDEVDDDDDDDGRPDDIDDDGVSDDVDDDGPGDDPSSDDGSNDSPDDSDDPDDDASRS